MADVLFDTLALARRLRDRAGFTPEHAEEAAQAIVDAVSGPVVSKPDLAELRSAMKQDFVEGRAAMKQDFVEAHAAMKQEFVEAHAALKQDFAEAHGAIKQDFFAARSAMQADFAELRGAVKADLAEVKSDLTRLVLTVATGQLALLLAAMFSLVRLGR